MKDDLTFKEILKRVRWVEANVTPYQIEEDIEKNWYKIKHLTGAKGLTKDQFIEASIKGPEKKLSRCENCKEYPCEDFKIIEEEVPLLALSFYLFFAKGCDNFKPNLLHNKDNIKDD